MKGISITLEGEEVVFFWKDGQVYTEGYDLESERMALALTSFGEGVGVLLVAINDCCKNEAEFMGEVKRFVAGYKKIPANQYGEWPSGQLLFEYYSYSSDTTIRWRGMYHARLSERHYKRILKEPGTGVMTWMAENEQLPEKYFRALAQLSNSHINYGLARNESCPIAVLEILAKDEEAYIRHGVVRNLSCPIGILGILAQDQDDEVRLSAKEKLAKIKDLEV